MSEKRRLDAMFSIRLSSKELETIQEAANKQGVTVSTFIRQCALQVADDGAPFGIIFDDIPQYAKDVLYGYREGYNAAKAETKGRKP